jgi:hypothetical protein
MKGLVVRIWGLADGTATSLDGRWLVAYDPTKPGRDPTGRRMTATIDTTDEPAEATRWSSYHALHELIMTAIGTRPDGRPDRPITAFNLAIEYATDEPDQEKP